MTRIVILPILGLLISSAVAQTKPSPNLAETLQWLIGTSPEESGNRKEKMVFESKGGCTVAIFEMFLKPTPISWARTTFSLSDIDSGSVDAYSELDQNIWTVSFHTANYAKKLFTTGEGRDTPFGSNEFSFTTNQKFAPRFVKAFKQAAELCGAKPPPF